MEDWLTGKGFEDCESWSYWRWRWEFIRRRDDYVRLFNLWALNTPEVWRKRHEDYRMRPYLVPDDIDPCTVPLPPTDSPQFVALPPEDNSPRDMAPFGFYALPNPAYAEVPETNIVPIAYRLFWYHARLIEPSYQDGGNGELDYTHLPPGHVAIIFDLQADLYAQTEGLVDYLKERAAEWNIPTSQRERVDMWELYLRTLDARAAGATWSQIIPILPDTYSNPTPQTARDVHKQAVRTQQGMRVKPSR